MPRCGVRKLRVQLLDLGFSIGRDHLFEVLGRNHLLVKRLRSRPTITTNSHHWLRKYPNIIKELVVDGANQLWVSDITYIPLHKRKKGHAYLSLITDAYTHEIVGECLHDTLDTDGPMNALIMALGKSSKHSLSGLIHHSDRGCQYCSSKYTTKLKEYGIKISMTENGDPYENAIAERVNGILKSEWINNEVYKNIEVARKRISEIIHIYNEKRPHLSLDMLTPIQARCKRGPLTKLWKNYNPYAKKTVSLKNDCKPILGRLSTQHFINQ